MRTEIGGFPSTQPLRDIGRYLCRQHRRRLGLGCAILQVLVKEGLHHVAPEFEQPPDSFDPLFYWDYSLQGGGIYNADDKKVFLVSGYLESTFNRIWRVPTVRPKLTRFLMYWALITLGTLVAVGSVDPNRFYPGMGTLFLRMMAETLVTALGRDAAR